MITKTINNQKTSTVKGGTTNQETLTKVSVRKVVGFICTPEGEKGSTYELTRSLVERLVSENSNMSGELITITEPILQNRPTQDVMENLSYNYSKGNTNYKGVNGSINTINTLIEKMINSDVVIFSTSVDSTHIPSQVMLFFKGLGEWLYRFPLVGKTGIIIVTSPESDVQNTVKYISDSMMTTGIKCVGTLISKTDSNGNLISSESMQQGIKNLCSEISPYITGERKIESDTGLENIFHSVKRRVVTSYNLSPEYKYWRERGLLTVDSFSQLLDTLREDSTYESTTTPQSGTITTTSVVLV
ncbi:MAG: hypothetical protein ABIH00_04115 [Armatimonadota bacterium]